VAEIGPAPSDQTTIVGAWTASRPIRVLDLVDIAERPSFYDIDQAERRWRLIFLADFAADVSQPIGEHQREEYRATQVFMDYLRSKVLAVDGILYRSSHSGEPCCALDVDKAHCIDQLKPEGAADGELRLVLQHYEELG
jgi:hypothetical protein